MGKWMNDYIYTQTSTYTCKDTLIYCILQCIRPFNLAKLMHFMR